MLYIIILRRNSRIIDYPRSGEKHFMFQDHRIFYSKYPHGNRSIHLQE